MLNFIFFYKVKCLQSRATLKDRRTLKQHINRNKTKVIHTRRPLSLERLLETTFKVQRRLYCLTIFKLFLEKKSLILLRDSNSEDNNDISYKLCQNKNKTRNNNNGGSVECKHDHFKWRLYTDTFDHRFYDAD